MEETMIVTFTNMGYCDMVKNTAKSMELASISLPLHVACLDEKSMEILKDISNIKCFPFYKNVSEKFENYFAIEYKKIVYQKLDLFVYLLQSELPYKYFFYIDSDVVFYKDPISYLVSFIYPETDIVFQNGECYPFRGTKISNRCTGVLFFRNTPSLIPLFTCINPACNLDGDQDYVNQRIQNFPSIKEQILPEELFPNGSTFKYPIILSDKYIMHYNYLFGNEKKPKMIQTNSWFI